MKPPKQKAKELVSKLGKDHALICVEEIMKLDIYASDYYYFNEVKKHVMKNEPVKWIALKAKNKRIVVEMWEENNVHVFKVHTRTLIDFKKRIILQIDNIYSVETFFALSQAFSMFTENKEITNKLLNLELSKCNKFKGTRNI